MRKFGPFDTSVFYEVENRRLQRAFNPQTGFVKSGQGAVTAGTGAQLVIAAYPDGALVDGLYVENPASETVTLTTNSGSTNPRIDRLVMRLDMGAKTIAPFQIVGTPAASPQIPPLVQTATVYDMPLCRYTFPGSASAQNPGSIVDEREWAGGRLYGKMWRTSGKSPALGVGTYVVGMDTARTTGGVTFTTGSDTLTVPVGGLYRISLRGYMTDGTTGGWGAVFLANRTRASVADAVVMATPARPKDLDVDMQPFASDVIPLAAGDQLAAQFVVIVGTGFYFGGSEAGTVSLSVEWVGSLNGATPL